MIKKIIITVDVERDISRFLNNSYIGVEEGLLPFLELLKNLNIIGDFFISTDICVKYPRIIEEIVDGNHKIGCHGDGHGTPFEYYCTKNFIDQYQNLLKSKEVLQKQTGFNPIMFRAPNFGANSNTIKALEKLNFQIDSSVLPGRLYKKWRLFTVYDFRSAPREIYRPSYENITKVGVSNVIEVPLTENPFAKGAPIGLGYLNTFGIESLKKAIESSEMNYITFLIHPWEMANLSKYYPNLKPWLKNACVSNIELLESALKFFKKEYHLTTIESVAREGNNEK